jgi:hypothetical protein
MSTFNQFHVHLFNGLCQQLGDETYRRNDERQNARQCAKPHGFDEKNGDDHRVKRTGQGNDATTQPRQPTGHQIASGHQSNGDGQKNAHKGGQNSDLQGLEQTLAHQDEQVGSEIRWPQPI